MELTTDQKASATLARLFALLAQTGWAPESVVNGDRQIYVKSHEEAIDIAINEQSGFVYLANTNQIGYRYVTFDTAKGEACITEFAMAIDDPFTHILQDFCTKQGE